MVINHLLTGMILQECIQLDDSMEKTPAAKHSEVP